jgi:hypothetical protein
LKAAVKAAVKAAKAKRSAAAQKAEAIEIVIDGHGYRVTHLAMPGCSKINTHWERCGVYYVNPIDGRGR